MTQKTYIKLNRFVLAISGEDNKSFLQSLITNDINKLSKSQALYALMLTPQGKFLYDFFFYEEDNRILLDCNLKNSEEIKKKLNMYKLRSKVIIDDVSGTYSAIAYINQENTCPYNTILPDPRSAKLPLRGIINNKLYQDINKNGFIEGDINTYEDIRINLGISSDADMEAEKSFPLEFKMDEFNAIDYQKGCYIGQEVTTRTHHRGIVRKKPYIVEAQNNINLAAYKGQEITSGPNKIGIMCSSVNNKGIALLRIEDLEKASSDIVLSGNRLVVI